MPESSSCRRLTQPSIRQSRVVETVSFANGTDPRKRSETTEMGHEAARSVRVRVLAPVNRNGFRVAVRSCNARKSSAQLPSRARSAVRLLTQRRSCRHSTLTGMGCLISRRRYHRTLHAGVR